MSHIVLIYFCFSISWLPFLRAYFSLYTTTAKDSNIFRLHLNTFHHIHLDFPLCIDYNILTNTDVLAHFVILTGDQSCGRALRQNLSETKNFIIVYSILPYLWLFRMPSPALLAFWITSWWDRSEPNRCQVLLSLTSWCLFLISAFSAVYPVPGFSALNFLEKGTMKGRSTPSALSSMPVRQSRCLPSVYSDSVTLNWFPCT